MLHHASLKALPKGKKNMTTMTDADPVLDAIAPYDDADAARMMVLAVAARFDGPAFDYIVNALPELQTRNRAELTMGQPKNDR
jgi:hypothetical protein